MGNIWRARQENDKKAKEQPRLENQEQLPLLPTTQSINKIN